MGTIGLPDIQRPFVWKNTKVRDLIDSMYRGYPVGYLLFWENAYGGDGKVIGPDRKQKTANLLIVDGQQRLTSLYAVIRGEKVLRETFAKEAIEIAFNPVTEHFEVADAAFSTSTPSSAARTWRPASSASNAAMPSSTYYGLPSRAPST
jgi:hypothetical protein